jgi:lipoprotein NlpD
VQAPPQPPSAALVSKPAEAPPLKPAVVPAPPKPADNAAQLNAGGVTWRWPADGKVVGTYVAGDQTKQGLDIAGSAGDPVRAAADGEVVYSGNGLIGYGELIIVKHNANFLSAYGHNRKRMVSEGERVKAGQEIAEMGSTSASRDELHFEIRKNGKPVNPLDYLPAK